MQLLIHRHPPSSSFGSSTENIDLCFKALPQTEVVGAHLTSHLASDKNRGLAQSFPALRKKAKPTLNNSLKDYWGYSADLLPDRYKNELISASSVYAIP